MAIFNIKFHMSAQTEKKSYRCCENGFTLLELLVVISIIGIIVSIVTASFSTAQKKGRDARRKGDMKAIQDAMEQCYSINSPNEYPTTITWGTSLSCGATPVEIMKAVPEDPLTTPYIKPTLAASDYCICAKLENTSGNSDNQCQFGADTTHFCVTARQ